MKNKSGGVLLSHVGRALPAISLFSGTGVPPVRTGWKPVPLGFIGVAGLKCLVRDGSGCGPGGRSCQLSAISGQLKAGGAALSRRYGP